MPSEHELFKIQKKNGKIPVITPVEEKNRLTLSDFSHDNRDLIQDLLKEHGALLLRGFPICSQEEFNTFVANGLGWKPWNSFNQSQMPAFIAKWMRRYFEKLVGGGDYRTYLDRNTVQLGPVENSIQGPHVEGGVSSQRARYLALNCVQPSNYLAETALSDLHQSYEDLSVDAKNKYNKAWNQFSYLVPSLNFWNRLLLKMSPLKATQGPEGLSKLSTKTCPMVCVVPESELKCLQPWAFARNTSEAVFQAAKIHFEGRGDTTPDSTAVKMNLQWELCDFNNANIPWSFEEQQELFLTIFKRSELISWQKGDVLLVDNLRMSHWRMNGEQGNRKLIQIQAEHFDADLFWLGK